MIALLAFLAVIFTFLVFIAALEGTKKPRPWYGRNYHGFKK